MISFFFSKTFLKNKTKLVLSVGDSTSKLSCEEHFLFS